MHEMLNIITDVRGVCLSVCLSRGSSPIHCAKMAEQDPVWGNTPGGLRGSLWNVVLDAGHNPLQGGETGLLIV